MSAFRAATEYCAGCGAELPHGAAYCPDCGSSTALAGSAVYSAPPESEWEARPEPHYFGVAPQLPLLAVAAGTLVLSFALLIAGHWPYGLIALGVGALLFAAFLDLAARRPRSPAVRAAAGARERTGSMLATLRARAAATADARRIRSGLALVEHERRTALFDLGEAAHRGDGVSEAAARAQLDELDRREHALHAELDLRLADAGERIRRARFPVEETLMVRPNEPNAPYPPPGEATPPQPAIVPEPYPPPDEGTAPEPSQEPSPPDPNT